MKYPKNEVFGIKFFIFVDIICKHFKEHQYFHSYDSTMENYNMIHQP